MPRRRYALKFLRHSDESYSGAELQQAARRIARQVQLERLRPILVACIVVLAAVVCSVITK